MRDGLKATCVALAAIAASGGAVQTASAEQVTITGRVIDGQLYQWHPLPGSSRSTTPRAGGMPMAIRNDENPSRPLSVPSHVLPPAGTCRLWYPDGAATAPSYASDCGAFIPRGAVMLIG